MSIIASIRQFLQLDKKTLSLEKEFGPSVGLFMNEWQHYIKDKNSYVPEMDCLGHHDYAYALIFSGFHSIHSAHF